MYRTWKCGCCSLLCWWLVVLAWVRDWLTIGCGPYWSCQRSLGQSCVISSHCSEKFANLWLRWTSLHFSFHVWNGDEAVCPSLRHPLRSMLLRGAARSMMLSSEGYLWELSSGLWFVITEWPSCVQSRGYCSSWACSAWGLKSWQCSQTKEYWGGTLLREQQQNKTS